MKLISQLLVAASLSIVGLTASAQTETTGNLVYTTVNPAPTGTNIGSNWTGFNNTSSTGGNTTGDNGAGTGYNPSTGTFMFGYNQGTIAYTYAINQALANAGAGIQVRGYDWSWDINNNNYDNRQPGIDTLTARITTFAANNSTILQQDFWSYNTKFDWTTFSGTVNYNNPGLVSDYGNMQIVFSGRDNNFWAGYYGPMVRNIDVRLRYGVDECAVNPQSSPSCPGYKTFYNNMWDDGYQRVDLPFTFPFYGQTFTTSYMFTNGVVGFLNPDINSYCCSGVNLNSNPGSPWNYAIYGLQTDLGPGPDSKFWSQVGDGGTSMRYGWDRVYELGTDNASTFNIQIKNSGYIGINYQSVNSQYDITAGIAGDISQGQYSQIYHGWGGAFTPNAQYTFTGTEITDQCANNPLYSPSCPGYTAAYQTQQCSINPLYSNQCPGYAQAYFTQQCSANTLYDPQCPGYATAYYNYQCGANPLYHTGCTGYAVAYFDQQCGLNPLYNEQCPGYATAYFNQQCSLNPLYNAQCPGYADAYYVQQCTANPLYDSGCTGYATAYFDQQCSLDALYNAQCPGYETAYFNQQCSNDALYNNQCPGYSEAYALKYIVIAAPVASEPMVVAQAEVAAPVAVTEIVEVQTTAPAATASPADSATAAVSLTPAPKPAEVAAAAPTEAKKEAKTTASSDSAGGAAPASSGAAQPKTTRQALAERRMAAAREKATESAKQNPGAMSSQIDSAASMEQQVELQNVVLGAMGFVAGFDAYGKTTIPDAAGYKPFEIYRGQKNVDSPAARGLTGRSDRVHREMVDGQYR